MGHAPWYEMLLKCMLYVGHVHMPHLLRCISNASHASYLSPWAFLGWFALRWALICKLQTLWSHYFWNFGACLRWEDSAIKRKIVLIFHAAHYFIVWSDSFSSQKKKIERIFFNRGFWVPIGGVRMHDSFLSRKQKSEDYGILSLHKQLPTVVNTSLWLIILVPDALLVLLNT